MLGILTHKSKNFGGVSIKKARLPSLEVSRVIPGSISVVLCRITPLGETPMAEAKNLIKLLEPVYDEYYTPTHWEMGKKHKNYFAKITKGKKKSLFDRKFINSSKLDDSIVYKIGQFPAGEIFEQRTVYVKGAKQEITFGGFFIIHHRSDGIYGEDITQKETLEYFDCKQLLPEIRPEVKNRLRVKMGTVVRQLCNKHGEEMVLDILTDILGEYMPMPAES